MARQASRNVPGEATLDARTLPGVDGMPLHLRLKEHLIGRIRAGEWPVGARIPTERALCGAHGVSRITVRQALDAMEREGYVERRQGSGTTARLPAFEQRLDGFYTFDDEIRRAGGTPSSQVLSFETKPCAAEWADRLKIAAGEPVLVFERLRLADGEPCAYEMSVVPLRHGAGITRERIEYVGLYRSMQESSGIRPGRAVETIRAVALDGAQSERLRTKRGAPALLVERVAEWSGIPVEYCRSLVRSDKYAFRIELGN